MILNRSLRSLCGLLAAPRRLGRRLLADSLARLLILSRALSRAVRTSQTPLLAPPSAALVCAPPSVRRTRAPCLAPRSRSDSPRPFIDMGEDAGQSRTMRDQSGSCAVGGVRPVRTDFLTQLADVLLPHVKTLRPEALRGEWGRIRHVYPGGRCGFAAPRREISRRPVRQSRPVPQRGRLWRSISHAPRPSISFE